MPMSEVKQELEDIALQESDDCSASGSPQNAPRVLGRRASGKSADKWQVCKSSGSEDSDTLKLQLPSLAVSDPPAHILKHQPRAIYKRSLLFCLRLAGIGGMIFFLCVAASGWHTGLVYDDHTRVQVMSVLCFVGLFMVALEDFVGVSKSAVVLLLSATLWTVLAVSYAPSKSEAGAHKLHNDLNHGLQDVGSVILFLLPAMGVVESIDHFGGFDIVTAAIRRFIAGRKGLLPPVICVLTFLLSSVIDNLTATIVAIKISRHLIEDVDARKRLGGFVVIAANAGGAWSPIGDVTTTMLWLQGKITAPKTVTGLFLPSMASGLLPLAGLFFGSHLLEKCGKPAGNSSESKGLRSTASGKDDSAQALELEEQTLRPELGDYEAHKEITQTKVLSLTIGIVVILLVPILKILTGLPPYLGMLLALALMWLVSDLMQFDAVHTSENEDERDHESLPHGVIAALYRIDLTGLLFFAGVLLSVGALDSAGILRAYATVLVNSLGHNPMALCTMLGISSAVVDNVPLVEASIDMFSDVPTDDRLWQLVALAAGTGGSILSVGSIAGVTLMSMEKVGFLWYCKHISLWALLGFLSGLLMYQLQCMF